MVTGKRSDILRLLSRISSASGLSFDSRTVSKKNIYFAVPGTTLDGSRFVEEAFRRGACSAVISQSVDELRARTLQAHGEVIVVENVRRTLAEAAAQFFGYPSRSLCVIGVTGTNGKTSTAWIISQALSRLKGLAGYVGTLGYARFGQCERLEEGALTTPDPVALNSFLAALVSEGSPAVCLEVSSQAIDQHRVDAVDFDCCVFTNLTRDHLDYHKTFEHYGEAKTKLFTELLTASVKTQRTSVINIDDPFGRELAVRAGGAVLSCSASGSSGAGVELLSHRGDLCGTELVIRNGGEEYVVRTKLIGGYNRENVLLSFAALVSQGFSSNDVARALQEVPPVPGRLERVGSAEVAVFVDYAHSPDALEKAQASLRELTVGRLITVFGCGGDRDRGKRPLMGRAVAERSDLCVVTSDNPRSENPEQILAEILPGIPPGKQLIVEPDRAKAIASAICEAAPGDVVLIAGKGHEPYQEICGVRHAFDDRVIAAEILTANSTASNNSA